MAEFTMLELQELNTRNSDQMQEKIDNKEATGKDWLDYYNIRMYCLLSAHNGRVIIQNEEDNEENEF